MTIERFRSHPTTCRLVAAGLLLGLLLLLSWPLPTSITDQGATLSLHITDRNGGLLREVRPDGRGDPIELAQVNPIAVEALVATEDRRFYRHPGVDPLAIVRAAWTNLRHGTVTSGGSTITMQVARSLRDRRERSLPDKLAETLLALRLELRLTKEQVLELWLGRVSFGNRTHGIEAAARLYFGKAACDLTAAEATYLIGLPQNPTRYNPFRHPERARARHRRVLAAMVRTGHLETHEQRAIEALPIELQSPAAVFRAPHFVQWLLARGAAGTTDGDRRDRSDARGPRIVELRTTLDERLQSAVEALARGHVRRLRTYGVSNVAVLVIENRSGAVRAYAGSLDFWNARIGGQNDGVRMLRQPGSALKPFTYAMALDARRYTAASILPDIELPLRALSGAFTPENYDRTFHGPVSLREALACSYNVPPIRLMREFGTERLLASLHRVGFASLARPAEHYGVGLTLGNGEVRLLELVRAYAGLACGGVMPRLRAVEWRRTVDGDTLRAGSAATATSALAAGAGAVSAGDPPLDPAVVHIITDILSDPAARAPAFGRGGPLELTFPCAVKTGTSKDYRDNWAIGYTPRYTLGLWVGNFDGSPMRRVSGVSGAGPLFKSIMTLLGPGGVFERPGGIEEQTICRASGALPSPICPTREHELFLRGTAPTDTCRVHRLIAIDRCNARRATPGTPPGCVEQRLFTLHPPEFHAWMRAQGMPLPPGSPPVAAPPTAAPREFAPRRTSPRLEVQHPQTGALYQIDPVLRRDYQRIELRAKVDNGLREVRWWIDGRELASDYRRSAWRLEPGAHRIELCAIDPGGERLWSSPSLVRVVGLVEGETPSCEH